MNVMLKKAISIILVMLMVLGGLNGLFVGGDKAYANHVTNAVQFAGGVGSEGDPYQIATADQLNEVRNHLEAGIYFKLTADIDLDVSPYNTVAGLSPLSDGSNSFNGNMDGNGFKIINLIINSEANNVGLFGSTGSNSVINNIILENVTINGAYNSGSLVGSNMGAINNSSATGNVTGVGSVGGLVGDNYGTIRNSYSNVGVIGTYGYFGTGGLVGTNNNEISNSYATGNVNGSHEAGGLVGINKGTLYYSGTINNSYATGEVTGNNNVGGLVGSNSQGQNVEVVSVNNSYATGGVTGGSGVGGLVGRNQATINNSYAIGPVSRIGFNGNIGGLAGENYSTINNSYYDKDTTLQTDSVRGTPLSTEEMQSNYNNDFPGDIWYFLPDEYPQLWAFTNLSQGSLSGSTKLNNVAVGMEFSIDEIEYTSVTSATYDNIFVNSGNGIFVRVTTNHDSNTTLTVDKTNIKPAAAPAAVLAAATSSIGSTQLTNVTDMMEYKINTGDYSSLSGLTEDNIPVNEGDQIYVRVKETTAQPASYVQNLTVGLADIKSGAITISAITGVTAPVTLGTPVLSITSTAEYSGSVAWSSLPTAFAAEVIYTASITLTPTSGYTFADLPSNFFSVDGATTTFSPSTGIITAEFPETISFFAGGTGDIESPYEIANADQLDKVRYYLNSSFILTADIDLNNYPNDVAEGWMPIGTGSDGGFGGNFDGNGYKIENLMINRQEDYNTGLFSSIGNVESVMNNIILENIDIYGAGSLGGLAARNRGTISNSSVIGTGSISGDGGSIGGLVGENSGTISNSYATINVSGEEEIGGLVGGNYGQINNSYATGSVSGSLDSWGVGGLAGYNGDIISNSYATGDASGSDSVGGLVGYSDYIISNSYATGNAIGDVNVGSLVGYNEYIISNSHATGNVNGTTGDMVDDLVWFTERPIFTIGTESIGESDNETITDIPYGTTLDEFKSAIIPATGYVVDIYDEDGTTPATTLASDNKVIVIYNQNTVATYTITVNAELITPITTSSIVGVTSPVTGATPVTTVTETTNFTGTVTWSSSPATFAASTAYTATITLTPKAGYTLTGVAANFFTVAGATTTNTADSGVVTAVFPETAAADTSSSGGDGPSTPASDTPVTSTDGKLTLPAGKSGEVSLEDEVTVSIPADASGKELKLTIDKVENTQDLVKNNEVLVSPVFEIMKNFSENFTKPVTLTFVFDLAIVKSNQRVAAFYYDEVKKIWIEIGGKVSVNKISVEVDHFTKFAVMAVDEVEDVPVKVDPTDTATEIKLSDISGHWAEIGIKQAVSIGFIKGYVDGTFKPNQTVTRAEFSVMLMNALKPQGAGAELTFTDTGKIGAWAQKAVAQAVQAGIINGYEDGTFRPNAEITRAEMASMLANAMGQSKGEEVTTSFADDKDIPTWASSSVAYMRQANIMQGKGENMFSPQDHATRAEAVTVLLNMLALENE